MTRTSFPIAVNYTQILAYVTGLERPGLLWTDDHVAQGFAWDDGIACFGIPDHDGTCLIDVDTSAAASDLAVAASLWAIAVPFTATASTIQVGTILDDRPVAIAQGDHHLVFEAHPSADGHAFRLRFCFIPWSHNPGGQNPGGQTPGDPTLGGPARFTILKQGTLPSGKVLATIAERG